MGWGVKIPELLPLVEWLLHQQISKALLFATPMWWSATSRSLAVPWVPPLCRACSACYFDWWISRFFFFNGLQLCTYDRHTYIDIVMALFREWIPRPSNIPNVQPTQTCVWLTSNDILSSKWRFGSVWHWVGFLGPQTCHDHWSG